MTLVFDTITESAIAGKNVVIKTKPGIGTVTQTLARIEATGLSIAMVDASIADSPRLGLLCLDGDTLSFQPSKDVSNAEVLVFDGVERASQEILAQVIDLMTTRTLNGYSLPSIKSVVAIYVDVDPDVDLEVETVENTVSVTVR